MWSASAKDYPVTPPPIPYYILPPPPGLDELKTWGKCLKWHKCCALQGCPSFLWATLAEVGATALLPPLKCSPEQQSLAFSHMGSSSQFVWVVPASVMSHMPRNGNVAICHPWAWSCPGWDENRKFGHAQGRAELGTLPFIYWRWGCILLLFTSVAQHSNGKLNLNGPYLLVEEGKEGSFLSLLPRLRKLASYTT